MQGCYLNAPVSSVGVCGLGMRSREWIPASRRGPRSLPLLSSASETSIPSRGSLFRRAFRTGRRNERKEHCKSKERVSKTFARNEHRRVSCVLPFPNGTPRRGSSAFSNKWTKRSRRSSNTHKTTISNASYRPLKTNRSRFLSGSRSGNAFCISGRCDVVGGHHRGLRRRSIFG